MGGPGPQTHHRKLKPPEMLREPEAAKTDLKWLKQTERDVKTQKTVRPCLRSEAPMSPHRKPEQDGTMSGSGSYPGLG